MIPDDDHTSLVLECFCSAGDHIWTMPDEAIGRRCVQDLVDKLNFIEERDVEDMFVIRTRGAYPVYDLQYHKKLSIIQTHLHARIGLHTVGRGGTFRYNNADHSIEMGLRLARKLLGEEIDHLTVNTEAEYHEEMRAPSRRRSVEIASRVRS
jgi:protoporphyrinogen oxidase